MDQEDLISAKEDYMELQNKYESLIDDYAESETQNNRAQEKIQELTK